MQHNRKTGNSMQGLAYILIISSLCFFSCSDAYTFDFATRGPGVDYTPVLEPYQQEMGTPSWSYCSREAEQFHKDFWGCFLPPSLPTFLLTFPPFFLPPLPAQSIAFS
eukprot:3099482-Rhodomonas_salina.1